MTYSWVSKQFLNKADSRARAGLEWRQYRAPRERLISATKGGITRATRWVPATRRAAARHRISRYLNRPQGVLRSDSLSCLTARRSRDPHLSADRRQLIARCTNSWSDTVCLCSSVTVTPFTVDISVSVQSAHPSRSYRACTRVADEKLSLILKISNIWYIKLIHLFKAKTLALNRLFLNESSWCQML